MITIKNTSTMREKEIIEAVLGLLPDWVCADFAVAATTDWLNDDPANEPTEQDIKWFVNDLVNDYREMC